MNRPKIYTTAVALVLSTVAFAQHNSNHQSNTQQNNNLLQKSAPQVQVTRTPISRPPLYTQQRPTQSPINSQRPPLYRPQQPTQPPAYSQRPPLYTPQRPRPYSPQPPTNIQRPTTTPPTFTQRPDDGLLQRRPIHTTRPPTDGIAKPPSGIYHNPTPIQQPPTSIRAPRQPRPGHTAPTAPVYTPNPSHQIPAPFINKQEVNREDGPRRNRNEHRGGNNDWNRDLNRGDNDDWRWNSNWFNYERCHYASYRNRFVSGQCYISPFAYYYGVCPPFITTVSCAYVPPRVVYVDVPVYQDNYYTGWQNSGDQNFLNDPYLDEAEPGLSNAIDELTSTFRDGNADALKFLLDPNTKIAVYQRGQYKYSISANDYLNLTQDAVESVRTTQFRIDDLHQVAPHTFSVSAKQVYRDRNGDDRTMYLSFVLEDQYGRWTITQVGTSPEEFHDLTQ